MTKKSFVILEKQQIIINMAINKMSKIRNGDTEIQ